MKHVLVIVVLAALTGCGNKPEAVQQIQPQPQVQQRPLISATEEFNLRGKCEDLVQKKYLALGGLVGKALTAEVKSHYNPDTNRCYAESYASKNLSYSPSDIPDNYATMALYDAQTNKQLAFADQEGDKSHGMVWAFEDSPGGTAFTTFDKARDYIESMMQDDK